MQSSNTVHVIAHLHFQPAQAEAGLAVMKRVTEIARSSPGNLRFELLQHGGDAGHLATIESWRDAAAVDAHMGSAAIGAALAELGPLLAGPPAIERFVQRA